MDKAREGQDAEGRGTISLSESKMINEAVKRFGGIEEEIMGDGLKFLRKVGGKVM